MSVSEMCRKYKNNSDNPLTSHRIDGGNNFYEGSFFRQKILVMISNRIRQSLFANMLHATYRFSFFLSFFNLTLHCLSFKKKLHKNTVRGFITAPFAYHKPEYYDTLFSFGTIFIKRTIATIQFSRSWLPQS